MENKEVEENTYQTSPQDLMQSDLKHYDEAASSINCWHSNIPKAIKAYYKKRRIENKPLKVYVAGPYSDNNVTGVLRNIGRGQSWASTLFRLGFAPFCPWLDRQFVFDNWQEDLPIDLFYKYSMAYLEVCDAVFVVPNKPGLKNWEDSTGTVDEFHTASKKGIPIFFNLKDLLAYRARVRYR